LFLEQYLQQAHPSVSVLRRSNFNDLLGNG
jgi:hypothetical protein